MRPRIVYTQISITLWQPMLGEFKYNKNVIILQLPLYSASISTAKVDEIQLTCSEHIIGKN